MRANFTAIDYPGASETIIYGISGNNIVGTHIGSGGTKGFLYDGTNWTNLKYPDSSATKVMGIDGDNLVGYYADDSFDIHGFIYNIPEPCTLSFLAFGAILAGRKKSK